MVVSRMRVVDFWPKRPSSDLCTKIPPTFETPTRDKAIDHLPLAVADSWHLDFPVARGDAEFAASAEIVGDLGTVDHVLARGASDGRAGSREIPSLDDRHALALRGQRPGEESGPPATEHHHIVFLGMRHVFPLRVNSSR